MLMRTPDNVVELRSVDAFDIEKHIHAMTDAISSGMEHNEILQMAQHVLGAARNSNMCITEQKKKINVLERDCITDSLTEVLNLRGFETELHRALSFARRNKTHGALIFIDLDDFKSVNDTHGHAAGDAVLRKVAQVLNEHVRDTDYVARIGGDEFAVILNDTTHDGSYHRMNSLHWAINHTSIDWQGYGLSIQASLGYEVFGPTDQEADILNLADKAMYAMKSQKTASMQYA
jgi:diguanylate cyclase (GGDEF)-like protein